MFTQLEIKEHWLRITEMILLFWYAWRNTVQGLSGKWLLELFLFEKRGGKSNQIKQIRQLRNYTGRLASDCHQPVFNLNKTGDSVSLSQPTVSRQHLHFTSTFALHKAVCPQFFFFFFFTIIVQSLFNLQSNSVVYYVSGMVARRWIVFTWLYITGVETKGLRLKAKATIGLQYPISSMCKGLEISGFFAATCH